MLTSFLLCFPSFPPLFLPSTLFPLAWLWLGSASLGSAWLHSAQLGSASLGFIRLGFTVLSLARLCMASSFWKAFSTPSTIAGSCIFGLFLNCFLLVQLLICTIKIVSLHLHRCVACLFAAQSEVCSQSMCYIIMISMVKILTGAQPWDPRFDHSAFCSSQQRTRKGALRHCLLSGCCSFSEGISRTCV